MYPGSPPLSIITNYNWQVAALKQMPRTFRLFTIRHTTIILVDSNLNMIQGDLRHFDRSTAITNQDAFNTENTVIEQQLQPTTSLGNDGKGDIGS